MSFLRFRHQQLNKSTAHSLRAYFESTQGGQITLSLYGSLKRASFLISRRLAAFGQKGSMTLEASFVLPFFLFAVINILYAVNIIGAQSRMNAALHQTGNKMAFSGYVYGQTVGSILPDGLAGVIMSEGYARGQILEYAGREYLEQSCIVDGVQGVSLAGSSVMGQGDIIDLQVSYRVKPFSSIMGFKGFTMSQRYYGKAWTGYDVTQYAGNMEEEDPMVFVTQTGTVYHLNRNCTYLNPSIEFIAASEVAARRNESGGKYYPCEICGTSQTTGQVYITSNGSSYHSRLDCSGLKRTIYTIPLSQVGARRRCSKCG